MPSVLVHVCSTCSCSSTVPYSAFVFSQNNYCPYCGAISKGINIEKICSLQGAEANMQQEELSRLFSANMSLSQAPQQQRQQQVFQPEHEQPQPLQVAQEQPSVHGKMEQMPQPITYISQHYTHSYHVAPVRNTTSALPNAQAEPSELEAILLRNSIDPTLLFPSQIDLFRNADSDQRLRLLELWRISPPQRRPGLPSDPDYTSRQQYDSPTSLAQEEAMAKLRFETRMEDKAQLDAIQSHQQQLDQSMDTESGAVQAARDLLASSPDQSAEPYIISGYDMLAAREYDQSAKTSYSQATDPVYNHPSNNGGLWEKNVGSIYDMENQYGAFAHARDHDVRPIYVDDEMMM